MKKTESLFAIYILEDEDGKVTVNVDSAGFGANCSTIGMELVSQLLAVELLSDGHLTVAVPHEPDLIQ